MKLVIASPRRAQGSEVGKLNEILCCEALTPHVWVCTECAQLVMYHAAPLVLVLSCSVVSDSLWPYRLQSARLLCAWDSPGKSTEVGCHALLQGIFLTQGSNSHLLWLLNWQADFFTTEPPGKPSTQPHWSPNVEPERPWSQTTVPLAGCVTLGKLLNHSGPQLFYPQHSDSSISSNLPHRTVVRISKI